MRQLVAGVVTVSLLAGCANDTLKANLPQLVNKPFSAAVAKLGMPIEERMIAGKKVFIWFSRSLDEGTEYRCQIRVIVANDTIIGVDFDGHNSECRRYARLFE